MKVETFNNNTIIKVTYSKNRIVYYNNNGEIIPNDDRILLSLVSDNLNISCATIGDSCDTTIPNNILLSNSGEPLLANNGEYLLAN